jgi:hypothetical protein
VLSLQYCSHIHTLALAFVCKQLLLLLSMYSAVLAHCVRCAEVLVVEVMIAALFAAAAAVWK